MTSAQDTIVVRLLVVTSLIAAGILDTLIAPRSYLISAPFAIPIVIAARWLSPTETRVVSIITIMVMATVAFVSGTPLLPTVSELSALAIVGYLGVQLDAQRLQTERHVQEAEAARKQVMRILDSITDAYLALRPDGTITYLNRAAAELIERYLHRPGTELIGKNIWQVFPEMVTTRFYREFRRTLAEGRPSHYEEYYAPFHVWLEVHAYPYQDGITVYFRDVTDRKRSEEERSRLLAYERALAEIAQTLVQEVELPRVIDVVLEDSLQLLGVDAVAIWLADPSRRELELLAARGKHPRVVELTQRLSFDATSLAALVARTGQMQIVEDVQTIGPELALAREIAAFEGFRSLLGVPLFARGHLIGVVVYAARVPRRFSQRQLEFNLTVANLFAIAIENARLFERVRETLRVREEFLATVGHELRTPITVIKGRAQLLLRSGLVTEPRARAWVESIVRHSDRIASLIDDLLAIGQLRLGQGELEKAPLDLAELIREEVARIARTVTDRRFVTDLDGPLIVQADRPLLASALRHLLENTLQYAPPESQIDVTARREDGRAVVVISRAGVGIASERLPHVFEPFYELVPPGEPGYVGASSVGLYVSKQIIEAHGGQIHVSSAPGQGATFTVVLPLARSVD